MQFIHSVIVDTKEFLENGNIRPETINQQLNMHELSYHVTQDDKEYAFERLILHANKYKCLVAAVKGHIKRKEKHLALDKVNVLDETTQEILKYAKEITKFLEKK
ncbi:MAG: hypothetical protein PF569_05270 [Candidatus Woesearchaeota archaeon]|jgi:hypothetical protein|nr:hypothetical protein [Candidatus Woesearchaeota archaeon]